MSTRAAAHAGDFADIFSCEIRMADDDRPVNQADHNLRSATRKLHQRSEADRELLGMVEKYEAIEKQSGKRVQVCIADYDEITYNFLHLGTERTHGFWRMINHATARKLREVGFLVRFVSLDLDEYMAWLARENLHDSSPARAQFAAAKVDSEMGIKSVVPVPISEPRGETPTRQASADVRCDIRRRDRWTRLTKTIVMTVAVVALAALIAGYNSRAPNHRADMAVVTPPEIRRAIPVEPEIRKAIPVNTRQPEINRWLGVDGIQHSWKKNPARLRKTAGDGLEQKSSESGSDGDA